MSGAVMSVAEADAEDGELVEHFADRPHRVFERRGVARAVGDEQAVRAVAEDLRHEPLDPARDVFFGFNTGCLETFEMLRDRRIITICDQIDPARVEEDIVLEEVRKWPGWQN